MEKKGIRMKACAVDWLFGWFSLNSHTTSVDFEKAK